MLKKSQIGKSQPAGQDGNGEGGIRTLGWFDPSTDFESAAFDHSATSPGECILPSDG